MVMIKNISVKGSCLLKDETKTVKLLTSNNKVKIVNLEEIKKDSK